MPQYESYLISAFKTGYYKATEPHRSPVDAFTTLVNAHVRKGILTKRLGYTNVATTGQSDPIVGIHGYWRRGKPRYLVADTDRLWSYAAYGQTLTDLTGGSDTFTGGSQDFFWFQDWNDICYMCNGVDSIYTYDEYEGTLAALDTSNGNADGYIEIQSCNMIFLYKARLCFFNCVVGGRLYTNRVYYSDVNSAYVQETNYDTITASDVFVSGCYLQEIPTLFGHEGTVAYLRYTGNADTPFEFKVADKIEGRIGPRLAPYYNKQAISVAHNGLMTWDGFQSREFGPQIRRWIDDIENFDARYMVATLRTDRPILYLAYPNSGSSSNDRILEYDFEQGAFSIHAISATALLGTSGNIIPEVALITAEFGDPSEGIVIHDGDVIRHPTYVGMVLMGDSAGKLYVLNYGSTDNGTAISANVWTATVNPYEDKGLQARLGRVHILVGTSATKTATVSFYKNTSTTAYLSLTLTASGSGDVHWETLNVGGEVGNYHQLSITGDIPDIHAIEFEFSPAGRTDIGS